MHCGDSKPRPRGLGADFEAGIAAARSGQPAAWDRLYRVFSPGVHGYLRMQGASEPEDLTSEVFLAVFRGVGSFSGDEAGFRSWVFVIAHRRLQDERRSRARRPQTHDRLGPGEPPSASAEDDALRDLATDRVRIVCAQLAPDQQAVLLLRILGDLTVEQVADVLGKSPGAVKQLQRRGLEAIRRISAKEGVPL